MFLFRSLVTGLAGACFVLLVMYEPPAIESTRIGSECPRLMAEAVVAIESARIVHSATIIDVAANVPASQIASLVHLEPGEHVVSVDDVAVASDLAAGAAMTGHVRSFVDLGVEGPTGVRRILLLVH